MRDPFLNAFFNTINVPRSMKNTRNYVRINPGTTLKFKQQNRFPWRYPFTTYRNYQTSEREGALVGPRRGGGRKKRQATRLECFERRGATRRGNAFCRVDAHEEDRVREREGERGVKPVARFLLWVNLGVSLMIHTCFSARNARRAAGLEPCRLNYGQTAFHAAHRPGETLKIHSKKEEGRGEENASTWEPVLYTYIQLHSLKPPVFFFIPLFVPVSHSRLPLLWATRANCCAFLL